MWWFSPSPSIPSHLLHVGKILFYPSWSITNRRPHQMWDADGFGVPMGCLMSVDIPEATENSLSPIKTSPHILVAASLSFPLGSLLEYIPSNHPAEVQTPPHPHPLPIPSLFPKSWKDAGDQAVAFPTPHLITSGICLHPQDLRVPFLSSKLDLSLIPIPKLSRAGFTFPGRNPKLAVTQFPHNEGGSWDGINPQRNWKENSF